jgi:hypothetical protein
MGSRSAVELLLLPVQLGGIRLGRPVDLLLDADRWRVLGFVVRCGDENQRFLPYAAADVREDEIALSSALLLLEDVEFYRGRSHSLRALLGGAAANGQRDLGCLRDLLVAKGGAATMLLVEHDGGMRELEPAGIRIEYVPAA